MAPFPYMPMLAIMASLAGQQVVQMSVFAYAAFMVEDLGVVDDKDKAGEARLIGSRDPAVHSEVNRRRPNY